MNLQIDFEYRSMRRKMTIYIGIVTVLEIILITISYYTENIYGHNSKAYVWVIILCSVHTLTMFLSQVIFFILTIKRRFTAINDFIKETPVVRLSDLKLLSRIHLKLTETIEVTNKSYMLIMMFFLTGAFCLLNVFLYCLKVLIVISNFEFFVVFSGKILLNIYSFTLTMFVIFIANRTSQQARRTTRVLFDVLHVASYDDEFITQLLNFVEQIAHSQTVFSCGLLNFNFKLFFKVIIKNRSFNIQTYFLLPVYQCNSNVFGHPHPI